MITKKYRNYKLIIIIVKLLYLIQVSYALPSDNLENITIKSDTFEIDYINGHAVYKGNVRFRQGTRELNANSLYVYFDSSSTDSKSLSNNLSIKEITAIGEPTTYQEKLKAKQDIIQAQANIIKFTPKIDLVTLQDNAVIKQNGKILNSDLLHYNIKTEIAFSPKQENKRNKLIIG